MDRINALKLELTELLAQEKTDYGRVLELANNISRLDQDTVRFSVDASHIARLGFELVSKQETAVAELIKNAYDADATAVDLVFKNSETKGGDLEIIDNGHGMSRDQLINGFMRISTQDKVNQPTSPLYKRQRAGRKGIGRFASQRLGEQLCIETQLEDEDHSLCLEIDWQQFESGIDLYQVSSQIEVRPAKPRAGTTLKIIKLRDAWTESQVQRTFRYVSELLQPFPLTKHTNKDESVDPGFKVTFFRENADDLQVVASEEQLIFAHALARIEGHVDASGAPYVTITSEKYNINPGPKKLVIEPRLKPKTGLSIEEYPLLAGVKFCAYYFISDELPTGTRSSVRELLNKHGGIRIYRNGFRVLPYGEQFDDWLGLQRSSALRELLPPHHNSNFLGFVEILDVSGERFEETASREGLLENDAFTQLQDYIYRAMMTGVIEVARARNKKIFSSDDPVSPPSNDEPEEDPRAQAAALAAKVRKLGNKKQDDDSNTSNQDNDEINTTPSPEALASDIEKLGDRTQQLLEENGMLRVLASLGLTIGEFTHEVRHALAGLNATAKLMKEDFSRIKGVSESYEALRANIELLQGYVRYFDNAVTQNAHRKLEVHELRDLISEFAAVIEPSLKRQHVELKTEFRGYDLFTKPMHKSEWASVFLNLFTNSLKAIQRARRNKGFINIFATQVDNKLRIDFSDNGDGIPIENRSQIFDAFFTTSTPPGVSSSEPDKLVGTGLGLKIVRDIIDAAYGEIEIVEPPEGYATCFRIEVPCATDEEIGDAKY